MCMKHVLILSSAILYPGRYQDSSQTLPCTIQVYGVQTQSGLSKLPRCELIPNMKTKHFIFFLYNNQLVVCQKLFAKPISSLVFHTSTHAHACMCAHVYTHTHAHTHTHIRTHAPIRTHPHTTHQLFVILIQLFLLSTT